MPGAGRGKGGLMRSQPVSQKRRDHDAAVRDEDLKGEPTAFIITLFAPTTTVSVAIIVIDSGPENNPSPQHRRRGLRPSGSTRRPEEADRIPLPHSLCIGHDVVARGGASCCCHAGHLGECLLARCLPRHDHGRHPCRVARIERSAWGFFAARCHAGLPGDARNATM